MPDYGYCVNNPLKYTDVTGNVFNIATLAGCIPIIGSIFSSLLLHQSVDFGRVFVDAVITGISIGETMGIGSACSTIGNFYSRAAVSALAHGVVQGGLSAAQGGKFWAGFASGALSSIEVIVWKGGNNNTFNDDGSIATSVSAFKGIGAGIGAIGTLAFSAIAGGAGSAIGGGNFWQGAVTGLIVSGTNLLNSNKNRTSNEASIVNPNGSQTGGAKAARILSSFIAYDSDKTFLGKSLQILSHFTWELPQQIFGVLTAEFSNLIGGIENVDRYNNGAVVISNKLMAIDSGITMGNIITVGSGSSQNTISHEFGHYIQSRCFGPLWTPIFGLPSITRAGLWSAGIIGGDYESFYTESNATRLGKMYSKF